MNYKNKNSKPTTPNKEGHAGKATHQVGPKAHRECLHDISGRNHGSRDNQPSDPLCDRIGLKHLRALIGRVLDLGVVTQQVCPLLQRLDPLLNHGPQDRDAV